MLVQEFEFYKSNFPENKTSSIIFFQKNEGHLIKYLSDEFWLVTQICQFTYQQGDSSISMHMKKIMNIG